MSTRRSSIHEQAKKEAKEIAETIGKALKEKGICAKVGIIPVPFNEAPEDVKEMIINKMKEFSEKEKVRKDEVRPEDESEVEIVNGEYKEGLNFNNFEEMLDEEGCIFDYHEMHLAGKPFRVKFWTNKDRSVEQVMVHPASSSDTRMVSNEEMEELMEKAEDLIDMALQKGNYDLAIEAIGKLKRLTEIYDENNKD